MIQFFTDCFERFHNRIQENVMIKLEVLLIYNHGVLDKKEYIQSQSIYLLRALVLNNFVPVSNA
jgi:uncharacterized protein YqgQ